MAFWLLKLETYKLKGFRVFIYKRTIVYIQLKKNIISHIQNSSSKYIDFPLTNSLSGPSNPS